MSEKRFILTKQEAIEKIHRMSLEIAENLEDTDSSILFLGIKKNGMAIAQKIKDFLQLYSPVEVEIKKLHFDKSDIRKVLIDDNPGFDNRYIILIDDVSNSGRTLLYALKPLLEYRPRKIQTLVMVERMHKIFPMKSDYVGLSMATTKDDYIEVEVEDGEVTGAYLLEDTPRV